MDTPVYLDHAAATPLDDSVLAAMMPYLTDKYYNPSARYQAARDVRRAVEAARSRVAFWLGARPAEIFFTAGGTESDNLAIHGLMNQFEEGTIVCTAIEHDAVLKTAGRYNSRLAAVRPDGRVEVSDLEHLVTDDTVLISVMYANNEIGTVQPIREIAALVARIRSDRRKRAIRRPLYLHTDACQASPYLDLHTARLGVDLLTINASKMYGPKQVGVLYVKAGIDLQPQVQGGGQERGLRSGTENVAGVVGLAAALELVQSRRHEEVKRLQELQNTFINTVVETMPNAFINGSLRHRLPNNIHLTLAGCDNERLMMQLDEMGVMVAVGSACSASNDEPSHVLRAIGLSDQDARSSLRITMGRSTDRRAIDQVLALLAQLSVAKKVQ